MSATPLTSPPPSLPGVGRLQDRRVIVVGAGTRGSTDADSPVGNGRAIAMLAGREGALVACVDRNQKAAHATVEMIAQAGGRAVPVMADVSSEDDCDRLVTDATQLLGGAIDGLVLNVGIGAGNQLAGTTTEMWDRVMAVNLRSQFLTIRACLPHINNGGSVVFIGSVAGLLPYSLSPAYDSSKSALHGLFRHVGAEGAPRGIRSNLVHPGFIDTPLGRLASENRPSRRRTRIPLGREGTGWDVAQAVLFFLSDESSYVTGQILSVDGGYSGLGSFDALSDEV